MDEKTNKLLDERIAKLDDLVQQYIKNKGETFSVTNVDILRDGGTIVIDTNNNQRYQIHKDDKTRTLFKNGTSISEEEKAFLIIRLGSYFKLLEYRVTLVRSTIIGLSV